MRPGDVVLPSVWDDRTQFHEAALYVDQCAERLLSRLSTYLDDVHSEPRGQAYWRIIIGSWLNYYVHATYDRWVHLEAALARAPELTTVVIAPAGYRTPRTVTETVGWLVDDAYNLQLYSQLLGAMGLRFPTRQFHLSLPGRWHQAAARPPGQVTGLGRVVGAVERSLMTRLEGRVGVSGMGLTFVERWRLAVATRGDLLPVPPIDHASFVGPDAVFDGRRCALADLDTADSFERAIVGALPVNFPTLYLEGHEAARTAARSELKRVRVKALVSATDWYFNDPVKHLAAEAAAVGKKMVAVQHGGGYGMYRFTPGELHEKRIATRYLVWGWADERPSCNWPSLALSRIAHADLRADNIGGLLLVATTQPRYLHQFISQPTGTQLETYFEWQARFLATLPAPLQRVMTVRPHKDDYGHATWPRIAERFPEVRRDRRRTFARAIRGSRLLVIDHCSTSFLEAFVADVPTVLFWDPARWELRPRAEPFFAELRRVGVLHSDPEGAARHVARVYDGAAAWWRQADVQAARRRLVERFALHRPGGAMGWAKGLADEVMRA